MHNAYGSSMEAIKFMCYSYFERKNHKILIFNIVGFPTFEISASLLLAPASNKCRI